jgi:hypothetical protein
VEFWFRADRNTHEIPVAMTQFVSQSFVQAPHVRLVHRYETRSSYANVDSTLRLELLAPQGGDPAAGFQGEHFFRAGEWTHVAYTWEVKQGEKMDGTLSIFVNGHRLHSARAYLKLKPLAGSPGFGLSREGKNVVLGPFEGSMDGLRISDTVRYTEDFAPTRAAPVKDANTRALFLFDGDLAGVSAFSPQPVELH